MKKPTGFQIREEERQSWGSITMVWIGAMICVPALMIGGSAWPPSQFSSATR